MSMLPHLQRVPFAVFVLGFDQYCDDINIDCYVTSRRDGAPKLLRAHPARKGFAAIEAAVRLAGKYHLYLTLYHYP